VPHPADHAGPLVFVEDLAVPVLAAGDRHHLERALRLRPGAPITVGDGRGGWRPARLGPTVEVAGEVVRTPAPEPALTIGFALTKGEKPELAVQKLTELGIDRIVPFRAARSVVRWDDAKSARALERLRSVARSAAAQCHRPWLPEVAPVAHQATLLAPGPPGAHRGGAELDASHTAVLVGPEGGWDDGEVGLAVPRVGLGEHVLRAETAAITAAVLLARAHRPSPR
jgi:16S rRNA (uracil1498-N3)-methyltransferase